MRLFKVTRQLAKISFISLGKFGNSHQKQLQGLFSKRSMGILKDNNCNYKLLKLIKKMIGQVNEALIRIKAKAFLLDKLNSGTVTKSSFKIYSRYSIGL